MLTPTRFRRREETAFSRAARERSHGLFDGPCGQGFRVSAFRLDLLEQLPCLAGHESVRRFDVVRAAGGIGHGVQVGFLPENALHIEGKVRVEAELLDRQAVTAAGGRRECFRW